MQIPAVHALRFAEASDAVFRRGKLRLSAHVRAGDAVVALALLATLAVAACSIPRPGTGGFARDRAAIEGLLYSYAHHFDGGRFDAFLACFADDAIVQFGDGPLGGKEQLEPALERGAYFARNGIQRRHVMTNLRVLEQTTDRASGDVYVLLLSTDADGIAPVLTGFYEFEVRRRDGEWRIQRWRAHLDGAADRLPGDRLPGNRLPGNG